VSVWLTTVWAAVRGLGLTLKKSLRASKQAHADVAAHFYPGRPFMAQASGHSDAAKSVGHAAWLVRLVAVIASAACLPATAFSADICKAVALRDVAAIENPESVIPRGSYDEAITYYNINKQTKMTSFCSHGGYCYPTPVFVNGQKQETLRLVNCKVGAKDSEDDEQVSYAVDVDRTRNFAAALRADDVDNRFLELGLCSACAGSVAAFYIRKPNSACGRLAKQALEGNPVAVGKLKDDPGYCQFP